jgi:hypothetical protein
MSTAPRIGHCFVEDIDIAGITPPGCAFRWGIYNEHGCGKPASAHPEPCGIDMSGEEEPGHYICDEPADQYPHCLQCGQHHDRAVIDCETLAFMMEADDQMLRYAR